MTFAITTGLIVFIVVAVFLFLARRVFRLAMKLAIVAVLVVSLVTIASLGWWRGWFGSSGDANRRQRPTPQSTQRPNANRRPAR